MQEWKQRLSAMIDDAAREAWQRLALSGDQYLAVFPVAGDGSWGKLAIVGGDAPVFHGWRIVGRIPHGRSREYPQIRAWIEDQARSLPIIGA